MQEAVHTLLKSKQLITFLSRLDLLHVTSFSGHIYYVIIS